VTRGSWPFRRRAIGEAAAIHSLHDEGFITIDLETTGLDPRRDGIVALAAIPFVGGRPGEGYVTLVDPGRPIPGASTAIHGITDAMVAGAPRAASLIERLDVLLGPHVLVGHGVAFDVAIIDRERRGLGLAPLDNPVLDCRGLAAALHPAWPSHELEAIAGRLAVPVIDRHTAAGDALTAGKIFLALLPGLHARGVRTLGDLLRFQRAGSAPF
jgi:DNA polymerase-3 subunit epsilon